MTAHLHPQPPPITCPSSLVASCGPLLGFEPESCLIALLAVPGRPGRVIARVDLVPDHTARDCAAMLAGSLIRAGGSRVAIVLWIDAHNATPRTELPGLALVESLTTRLSRSGIGVDACLATNGEHWWELLCRRPGCCSEEAQPVDPDVAGAVRVQYAVAGYAPLASRTELALRLRPEPEAVARTERHLARASTGQGSRRWRERQLRLVWPLLRPGPSGEGCEPGRHTAPDPRGLGAWPSTATSAQLDGPHAVGPDPGPESVVLALSDIGVRDVVLLRLASSEVTCRSCWDGTLEALAAVVRAAPPSHAAPAATLLAVAAWLAGEGALATIAVEHALADRSDYRLAQLASQLIGSGVDPRSWRGSVLGLTEEDCLRTGLQGRRREDGGDAA